MKQRVLHYNWAQFDDPEFRGGGVSVYLRNLLNTLADDPEYELSVLSSGHHYTFMKRRPRYEETKNSLGSKGVRSFRILNSPIKAPAHDMFYDLGRWRSDSAISDIFSQVLTDQGPFDTVVLHSMEGISSEVLALREKFPHTRFVYMWHNYMPICPQIELLYMNREDCADFEDGRKCQGCISGYHNVDMLISPQRLGSSLEFARLSGMPLGNFLFGLGLGVAKIGQSIYGFVKDLTQSLRGALKRNDGGSRGRGFQTIEADASGHGPQGRNLDTTARGAGEYKSWRDLNVQLLNSFDAHLVVSDLVADTITGFGLDKSKVFVSPLGMDLHSTPAKMRERANTRDRSGDRIRLSFIGYGIPSKGLPFITRAFMEADDPIFAEKVELVIYARLSEHEKLKLTPLRNRFADVRVVDGYQRKDLGKIAREIDLNIVPSIWRETYNQVGYELLCLGTPSLLSSTVGLGMFYDKHEDFLFESGDAEDFLSKLKAIVTNPSMLNEFWDNPPKLPTMDAHIAMTLPAIKG